MGLIRKTMSIGTFGLVDFRSRKERLARAEDAVARAEAERDALRDRERRAAERAGRAERSARKARRSARRSQRKARRHGGLGDAADVGDALVVAGRRARRRMRREAKRIKQTTSS